MALLHHIEGRAPSLNRRSPFDLCANAKMDGAVLVQEPKHMLSMSKRPRGHRERVHFQSQSLVNAEEQASTVKAMEAGGTRTKKLSCGWPICVGVALKARKSRDWHRAFPAPSGVVPRR
jgi:hypothetical protein